MAEERESITFFPWLHLDEPVQMGRVAFVPYEAARPREELQPVADKLNMVLSSYRDIEGRGVQSCTVAVLDGRSPDAEVSDNGAQEIQKASALLALTAFAENEYFVHGGAYVNSIPFVPHCQSYAAEENWLSPRIRTRHGSNTGVVGEHGRVAFSVPLECYRLQDSQTDRRFAESLSRAWSERWAGMAKVLPAVSFFLLANTDSPLVIPEAEAILMAVAFDQLFGSDDREEVAEHVGGLLQPYGTVTPESDFARGRRLAEESPRNREWFLHRLWAWEFYTLRSMLVHGRDYTKRPWSWSLGEHILVAAFTFPLFVKLLLSRDGLHELSLDDRAGCTAMDKLLAAPNWAAPACVSGRPTRWQEVMRQTKSRLGIEEAVEHVRARAQGTGSRLDDDSARAKRGEAGNG